MPRLYKNQLLEIDKDPLGRLGTVNGEWITSTGSNVILRGI